MSDTTSQLAGPLRVLPAELNTEIFKFSIWVDTHSIGHGADCHLPPHVTPLTLGAVCSSWRSFVWETADLWTIIIIYPSRQLHETQTDILDLWLHNSKSYPLDIWFDADSESYGSAALQKLVNESTRWKKFNAFLCTGLIDVFEQIHGKIPTLQSAFLQLARSDIFIDGQKRSKNVFEDAPQLRHFALTNGEILGRLVLPWSHITTIKATNVPQDIWDVLNKCSSLEECEISIGYTSADRRATDVFFDFPRLRSLSITEDRDAPMAMWLQQIRFPELRQLHLVLEVLDYNHSIRLDYPFQHLADFISRSECALENLQLTSFCNISDVLPILDEMPSLQSFAVRNSKISIAKMESFFNSLFNKLDLTTNSYTIFLPNLEEIRLTGRRRKRGRLSHDYRTCSNLLKVLQQRSVAQNGVSKMIRVDVKDVFLPDERQNKDVVLGLRELNRKGMKITIRGS